VLAFTTVRGMKLFKFSSGLLRGRPRAARHARRRLRNVASPSAWPEGAIECGNLLLGSD
jgi:hypothetical protein